MSRIGNLPITIPSGVSYRQENLIVVVKGPKGEIKSPLPEGITIEEKDGAVKLIRKSDSRQDKQNHGMARAVLNNSMKGVSAGWQKTLELVGVGYRAQLKGTELVLSLGYSHEVKFPVPTGIKATVRDATKIDLEAIDKQLLGQVAAEIRSFRPPEPYKGKGVKYSDETIRRKAGKAGKAGKK